jgi:hypothetical protein
VPSNSLKQIARRQIERFFVDGSMGQVRSEFHQFLPVELADGQNKLAMEWETSPIA